MDKIDTTTETPEENQPTQSLGELLKSYRESAAMDYDQAADTLCLTPATLQALENEQFDLLPEAPYIRGYLRSYAKLANVSSAEAIALYEEIRGGTSIAANLQDNFAPTSSVANIIKPTISPLLVRFGFIAVIVLSLAVISMLPDVREWSSAIWTDFSEKTVAIEQQSQQEQTADVVATAAEKSANTNDTVASKAANATQASTQTATENSNTAPQTQAALSNMDGKINREGQSTLAENTPTDSTDKNTNKPQDVTPQNIENKTTTASETETNTAGNADTVTPTATANTNSNAPPNPSVVASATNTVATDANNNVNAVINSSSTDRANASQTAAVSNNGANPTANETTNNPDGTVVASTTNPSDNNANPAADPSAEGENSETETPTETQVSEVSVKLVFTKEVWMRVNSKKKKVFSGLKKAGDTEEFKATKPLSFKVGNAPGVEIYINGQRYDQAPHTRGAVSRFKIEDTP